MTDTKSDPSALRVLLGEAEKFVEEGDRDCNDLRCDETINRLSAAVEQLLTELGEEQRHFVNQCELTSAGLEDYNNEKAAREAAEAQRDQLREFAIHKDGCPAWPEFTGHFQQASKVGKCTCGLSSLLTTEHR